MSFGSYHADINLNLINDTELSLLIVHMSQYDNMYEFNETMERQRRFNDTYPDTEKYQWNWDSTKNRNNLKIVSHNQRIGSKIHKLSMRPHLENSPFHAQSINPIHRIQTQLIYKA